MSRTRTDRHRTGEPGRPSISQTPTPAEARTNHLLPNAASSLASQVEADHVAGSRRASPHGMSTQTSAHSIHHHPLDTVGRRHDIDPGRDRSRADATGHHVGDWSAISTPGVPGHAGAPSSRLRTVQTVLPNGSTASEVHPTTSRPAHGARQPGQSASLSASHHHLPGNLHRPVPAHHPDQSGARARRSQDTGESARMRLHATRTPKGPCRSPRRRSVHRWRIGRTRLTARADRPALDGMGHRRLPLLMPGSSSHVAASASRPWCSARDRHPGSGPRNSNPDRPQGG